MNTLSRWHVAAGVLALTLVGQFTFYRLEGGPAEMVSHVAWQLAPRDSAEIFNAAQAVVFGKVESIQAGADLVVPVKNEPGGVDRIPTERIVIALEDNADKGSSKKGNKLVIFRTGGQVELQQTGQRGQVDESKNKRERLSEPAGGKPSDPSKAPTAPAPPAAPALPAGVTKPTTGLRLFTYEGDPPYKKGQRVYLALTAGINGTLRPVHPAGRYLVRDNNTVQAVGDDPVSLSNNNKNLADLRAAAKGGKKLEIDPNLVSQIAEDPEFAHQADIYRGDAEVTEYDAPEAVAELIAAAEADTSVVLQEIAPAVAELETNISSQEAAIDAANTELGSESAAVFEDAPPAAADTAAEPAAEEAAETEAEKPPAEEAAETAADEGLSGTLMGSPTTIGIIALLIVVAGFVFWRRRPQT